MWSNLQARFEFLRSCCKYCVVYLELSISTIFKQLSSNVIHTRSFVVFYYRSFINLCSWHQWSCFIWYSTTLQCVPHCIIFVNQTIIVQFVIVFFAIDLLRTSWASLRNFPSLLSITVVTFLVSSSVRFLTVLYRLFWVFVKIARSLTIPVLICINQCTSHGKQSQYSQGSRLVSRPCVFQVTIKVTLEWSW